jgi:SOS response regulatory protein OraA/RecX
VLQDLRHRRVAPALAEKTVHAVYENVDESALIEEWIRRKYRTTPREGLFREDKDLASAYRRLLRAGFRTGEIVRVLKRFAKNPELLDSFEPPEEE